MKNSVYVRAETHYFEISATLMQHLIANAEACGSAKLRVVNFNSANNVSIREHERHGVRVVDTAYAVGGSAPRWLDGVLMQCLLDAGDCTPI